MADDFDPYYTWLGIPPEEQPATHYRLLGVREFEPNLDVISNAGDQRMAFLRTFQVGKRSALSQRLLNEMAAAKVCLLDTDQRKVYDAKLKAARPNPASPVPQLAAVPKVVAAPQIARPPAPAPRYSPPTLAPLRQVPVTRPTPVAPRPSVAPEPFAAVDPFADVAKAVQTQSMLPAKPALDPSDDFSDQAMAVVRAAVSRVQESPLATAAYGMLALGVVMFLAVCLWVTFGRGQPTTVAGVPSAPAKAIPNTPQQSQNLPSTTEHPAVNKAAPEAPKVAEPETSKTATKTDVPGILPSEGPKTPSTSPPPTVPPVETVPEIAVKPDPVPPVTPAPTKNSPAPEPASVLTTAIYNVLPGKFSLPRVARLSPTALNLAEFAPGSRTVRVWSTSPVKKTAEPLSITTPTNVRCVRFSENDRLLAIGADNSIDVWDLESRKNFRVAIPGPGIDAVFCDNDKLVAVTSAGTKTVRLIEVKSNAVLHTFQSTVDEIRSLAAGQQWLAALGASGQVALYDVRQCIHHGNLVPPQPELPLTAVHMRGKEIFAFDSRCMTGWSAQELKLISEWSNTRTTPVFDACDVHTLDFTQQENGTLKLFRVTNHEAPLARIAAPGGGKFEVIDIVAERILTIGQDEQLLIWNLERVKEAKGTINPAEAIATWSGEKKGPPAASVVTSPSPKPTPSAGGDDGPLETVEPAAALEALRGLGVQQLPSTSSSMPYLNLWSSKVTDADAKYVAAFPDLQNLYADRVPFTGRALRYFARLKELKVLSITGSRITDDDLAHLSKCSNLEVLMIGETLITAKGIAHLKDLPKLRFLQLPQNMGRDLIPVVSKMKQMERLSPMPPRLDDGDLAQLSGLSHLKSIDLQQASLTLEGYKHLEKFHEMEDVGLTHDCPREALASLKNMRLQFFTLPKNARDEDVAIFNMPTLQTIQLNAEMTDKAVATLGSFKNLEQVSLDACQFVSDGGLLPLQRLKRLKEIGLPRGTGDAGLRVIATITSLERIGIPYTCVATDEGIEAIAALPKLTNLCLPFNTSDRSCAAASKIKGLQSLVIAGTQVTDKGLKQLKSLEKLNHLALIKPISKPELDVLKSLKQVQHLSLQSSGLTEADAAELRKALPGVNVNVGR